MRTQSTTRAKTGKTCDFICNGHQVIPYNPIAEKSIIISHTYNLDQDIVSLHTLHHML